MDARPPNASIDGPSLSCRIRCTLPVERATYLEVLEGLLLPPSAEEEPDGAARRRDGAPAVLGRHLEEVALANWNQMIRLQNTLIQMKYIYHVPAFSAGVESDEALEDPFDGVALKHV